MTGFDLTAHLRERTRRAEERADLYEQLNAKLHRLLGYAVLAAAGDQCCPWALLAVLEDLDEQAAA